MLIDFVLLKSLIWR